MIEGSFFTGRKGVEYIIHSKPDSVSFECPYCMRDVKVAFADVTIQTRYWWDGAVTNCPMCDKEVDLDDYDYQ